jgi:hypothetical protein
MLCAIGCNARLIARSALGHERSICIHPGKATLLADVIGC